ncbi:MAG: formylmethanofuran dehydrogenase subunit C [Methylophilaceae bacterium]
MTPLTFTLNNSPSFKLNCSQLTPNLLANLTIEQIKNLKLTQSNNGPTVADFFDVAGDDSQNIQFKKSTVQLDFIGHKMNKGTINIEGNAGDFLGSQMQNGTIICHGNTGDRLADQMRRGLILVDGNAGEYCASRMIAGTIGVYGEVAQYIGYGMKRGTILLTKTPNLHCTIQDCGTHHLPFLALLFKSFKSLHTKFNVIQNQRVQRFAGDLACQGRGEILVISP